MSNLATKASKHVDASINYDDIPKMSKLTKKRKNPFSDEINKEGYSIITHYTPEDIANGEIDDSRDIAQALIELMSSHDVKRLLLHIRDNYNLPCSPTVWETVDSL